MNEWFRWIGFTLLNGGYLCSWERWKVVHSPNYCSYPRNGETEMLRYEFQQLKQNHAKRMAKARAINMRP